MTRRYYSIRTGKNPLASQIDLPMFLRLFVDLYQSFYTKDIFKKHLGMTALTLDRWQENLAVILKHKFCEEYESQIFGLFKINIQVIQKMMSFDIIEFLYDYVSKPIEGFFHNYNDCGWHYQTFSIETGRQEYRNEINDLLRDYTGGYELSNEGEILALAERGSLKISFKQTCLYMTPKMLKYE